MNRENYPPKRRTLRWRTRTRRPQNPSELDFYNDGWFGDDKERPQDLLQERPYPFEPVLGPEDEIIKKEPRGLLHQVPSPKCLLLPLGCALISFLMCLYSWNSPSQDRFWVSGASIFRDHQYWRLFAALAGHADLAHWLHNAPLFIIFAWLLRAYFGRLAFPVLSFFVGILCHLVTVWFYDPDIRVYGASGMLYGMIALWLVFYVRHDRQTRLSLRLLRAAGFALLMLVPQQYEPRVSYLSHASGFAIGLFFGVLSTPILTWLRVGDLGSQAK